MTPTQRQAMEMALACLVRAETLYGQPNQIEQKALRAALAEQADDKSDAERYRWLREKADLDVVSIEDKEPGRWERPYLRLLTMEDLDAAIDAARSKS